MNLTPQLQLSDSNSSQQPSAASQITASSLEAASFHEGQTDAILSAIIGARASNPTLKGREGATWAWDIYIEWNRGLMDESGKYCFPFTFGLARFLRWPSQSTPGRDPNPRPLTPC